MARPVIKVASANVKSAELHGSVVVGEETAKMLTKKLGREVLPGEEFDLGLLSYYNKNFFKRMKTTIFDIKKNVLN